MLLLVSPQQGLHKSTFVRELLPPELRDYSTACRALPPSWAPATRGSVYRLVEL
jgi:hypothetical protein